MRILIDFSSIDVDLFFSDWHEPWYVEYNIPTCYDYSMPYKEPSHLIIDMRILS